MTSSDARTVLRLTRGARLACGAVVAVAVAVAVAWLAGTTLLERLHPVLAPTKLNSAIALICLGVALSLSIPRPGARPIAPGGRRLAVQVLTGVAIAIGAATLAEYALGVELGIDELLAADRDALAAPGRMSPATAISLIVLGVAIALLERRAVEWIALAVALCSHVTVLGYVYGVRHLYVIGPSVALHTALSLYALAIAVLLARPRRGLMGVVSSASPGGVLARRLLPAALVLPAALALLAQWGEHAGLYGAGFGHAILVAVHSVVFVALIWRTAAGATRADRERRAAEDAVRESEADLAITLASIADAVIATDEHGRIKRMNAVAERLTGWPGDDARGRPLAAVFQITDEETGGPVESPLDRVLRDGAIMGLANHTVLTARDGAVRSIASSAAPIRNAQGVTRGVVLVFQDRSAARAAERRLRDSEARKTAVLESALDAIVSIDATGVILEVNSAAEALFARPRDEVIGMPLADALIPSTVRDTQSGRLARLASGESSLIGNRNEVTAFRPDGTEFPVEISMTHVANVDPVMFTIVLRDVSEPRRARAELMRSHDRLRALAQVSDAFAAVVTSFQPLIDTIARMTAELIGDGCLVTLISDDGLRMENAATALRDPALERAYREHLAQVPVALATSRSIAATVARTGKPMRADIEPAAMVAQSEEALRPLVARLNVHGFAVVPIRARKAVIGTLSLMRNQPGRGYTDDDITLLQDLADRAGLAIDNARLYAQLEQRVRARTAELEASNKDLEAFSYSVAHDLRAPLRAISGFSDFLLEEHGEPLGDGRNLVQRIQAATQRMNQLIEALLALSKISRTELRRARVDVSELARGVIARLRAAQPERQVEVVIQPGLAAHADPDLLEVVLTNLLGNAWKFTGKRAGARIELAQVGDDRPAVYVVRDNGAGFDPAYTAALFRPFQRLHTHQEFEGTGIGLATVQRIIQNHGGRIWAEAEVGHGAAFYFVLEAAAAG